MTEDELLQGIVEAARIFGWRVYHVRRSDKAGVQGDIGFPDLVLAKDGRVIFAELKDRKGQPTQEQVAWLLALRGDLSTERLAGQPIVALWRPADYDDVLQILQGNRAW